jgi:hypothetical protein
MPSPTYPTAMHIFLSVAFLPEERGGRKLSVPLGVNQAVDFSIQAFVQTPVRQACDTAPQIAFRAASAENPPNVMALMRDFIFGAICGT